MPLFPEIFRSVELIWILWGISIPACLGLSYALRQGERIQWKKLNDEDGAAYAVPYVMTFPLYALFVGLVVECSLLLVTKVGTMYAAYSAVRSAVVWESAKTGSGSSSPQKMNDKAKQAAILAMVPFASGGSQHAGGSAAGTTLLPSVLTAAELFREGRFVNPNYLTRKVRYAAAHTQVASIGRASNAPDALLTATLDFEAPFHIPGIGRFLGKPSGNGYYVINVHTTAALPSESPQNETRDIGIQYLSE
ncbi:MAG: hypothetical protein V4719_03295 [Planctomycetota bacterium]